MLCFYKQLVDKFYTMKKILLTFALLCSLSIFAQWEPVALPTTENLIAISFKDNMTGFCIAENGIILKVLHWVSYLVKMERCTEQLMED